MTGIAPDSLTVALLAPLGRDAALAAEYLRGGGFEPVICADFEDLCHTVRKGVGCALVTEEALAVESLPKLAAIVTGQPAWSDLPFLVFSSRPDALRQRTAVALQELGNVSFIDRPVRRRTLLAAVRSALRARSRQYDARRAIEGREQFLAMLGHELRNPLAAILLANDLLGRHRPDDTGLARYTATVDRQTRHLHRLVDDLLDVARVTSGKVSLRRTPVDFGGLVGRCVEAHQPMAETYAVTLAYADPHEPLTVDGDAVRLEQITNNLLTNALKYTPRGGRVLAAVEPYGKSVLLSVTDTGVGIEPEHLGAIFELFNQVPTALDRARGGLGLGLTLVRGLVELHGGTVQVTSDGPGRGSRFEVVLPPSARGAGTLDVLPPVTASAAPARPRRVVIVDDNPDIRGMLVELLELLGYLVEEAADGPGGLTRIMSSRPEIALVDIGLPGFDGYELARRARQAIGHAVRLVAMTGYGQTEDRARSEQAGFDAHLTKPVSVEAIEAVINDLGARGSDLVH